MESTVAMLVDELFPEQKGPVSSHMDLLAGTGHMLGPLTGGIAFHFAGFRAPTMLCALVFLILAISSVVALRGSAVVDPLRGGAEEGTLVWSRSFRQPDCLTFCSTLMLVVTNVMLVNSYESIMSLHFIRKEGWTNMSVGLLYAGYGLLRVIVKLRADIIVGDAGWRVQQRAMVAATVFAAFGVCLFHIRGSFVDAGAILILGLADGLAISAAMPLFSQSAPLCFRDKEKSGESGAIATWKIAAVVGGAAGPLIGMPLSCHKGECEATSWYMLCLGVVALASAAVFGFVLLLRPARAPAPATAELAGTRRQPPPA